MGSFSQNMPQGIFLLLLMGSFPSNSGGNDRKQFCPVSDQVCKGYALHSASDSDLKEET